MPIISTTKEEIEQDDLLVSELEDVAITTIATRKCPEFSILKYIYSHKHNWLFCMISHQGGITLGKLVDEDNVPVDARYLFKLRSEYSDVFLQEDAAIKNSLPGSYVTAVWIKLYTLFIQHLPGIFNTGSFQEVLTTFKASIQSQDISFNIALLFDLAFRFSKTTANKPIYFLNVSSSTTLAYFHRLIKAGFPKVERMYILDGYERESIKHAHNPNVSKDQLLDLSRTDNLLDKALNDFKSNGAQFEKLTSLSNWDTPLTKGNSYNFIFLITHFSDGSLLLPEGSFISFTDLLEYIRDKKDEGTLKEDIILDATTCHNFDKFCGLTKEGIPQVYMSMNKLNIEITTYTINELCFGNVAKKLGWGFPYLDGKKRLPNIYSDINRAFYVQMRMENKI